jgi:Arc/MetJ family transcription regulator
MLEFGVEVTTGELVALERALRRLDTDDARAAVTKAHRPPALLTANERETVLLALRALLGDPGAADNEWDGLARLATKLEHEQETAVAESPPKRRARSTKS